MSLPPVPTSSSLRLFLSISHNLFNYYLLCHTHFLQIHSSLSLSLSLSFSLSLSLFLFLYLFIYLSIYLSRTNVHSSYLCCLIISLHYLTSLSFFILLFLSLSLCMQLFSLSKEVSIHFYTVSFSNLPFYVPVSSSVSTFNDKLGAI